MSDMWPEELVNKKKSSLDDKLWAILENAQSYIDDEQIKAEAAYVAIAQIKQSFADERYIQLSNDCSHRFVHTYDDRQHEGETCTRCGQFRHMSQNDADSHIEPAPVMTGQEWYDRFEKELGRETIDANVFLKDADEAAKRAAGINE